MSYVNNYLVISWLQFKNKNAKLSLKIGVALISISWKNYLHPFVLKQLFEYIRFYKII